MNIFKQSTFTWWQMGMFKLAVLAIGIVIGAYWQAFFLSYIPTLLVIGIVLGLYVGYVWWKQ